MIGTRAFEELGVHAQQCLPANVDLVTCVHDHHTHMEDAHHQHSIVLPRVIVAHRTAETKAKLALHEEWVFERQRSQKKRNYGEEAQVKQG